MKLCTACAREEYGSMDVQPEPARADEDSDSEQATFTRDEEGKLALEPIHMTYSVSNTSFRKRLAYLLILLIVCSSVVSVLLPFIQLPAGFDGFEDLDEYYTVNAWLAYTDSPDEHIPCAMMFYFFENDTWHELETHDWGLNTTHHEFGKVPLNTICNVRASVEWGTWSPAPTTTSPFTLDNVFGYQLLTYAWNEFTISVEIIGSAY
jgi:hypothetical protein